MNLVWPTRALTRLLLPSSFIEFVAADDFDPRLVPTVGTGGCHVFAACSVHAAALPATLTLPLSHLLLVCAAQDTHELDSACPTPGPANLMPTECIANPPFPYDVDWWLEFSAGNCSITRAADLMRSTVLDPRPLHQPGRHQRAVCVHAQHDRHLHVRPAPSRLFLHE